MLKEIVFWGATGHAKVLRELTQHLGYNLVALFDNDPKVSPPFPDVPLYFGSEGFGTWKGERGGLETACLVAIGGSRGHDRVQIQRFLEENQLKPVTVIHPSAFVASSAILSKGCQVLAQATVCVNVVMGEACIVNTSSSVDHESVLGNGVHIGPGATLAGCVSVGDYSLIGAGAVVLPRIKIGSGVVIGAGAVVTEEVPDGKVAFGNPARIQHHKVPGS